MGSTEVMKRHRVERAGVNTEECKRLQRNTLLGADAGVCPEQANTQEKTLAMADLVRESRLTQAGRITAELPVARAYYQTAPFSPCNSQRRTCTD